MITDFEDEDGEQLMFNAAEIVLVMAPLLVVQEGKRIVMSEEEDSQEND